MGIRFDKDSRRATNGPMIFFSDPSAEHALTQEIRQAVGSRLSFYAYRRPGDMMISFGSSESVVEGIGVPGFVVAEFIPGTPYLTIPYKNLTTHKEIPVRTYEFPARSTTREEYYKEIERIKKALTPLVEGKIVAARAEVFNGRLDPGASFSAMCREYPTAFVFCFSTPHTGCWIGASPELLLSADGDCLATMALAGSRPAGSDGVWDDKNIEEQRLVADFICRTFENAGITAVKGDTFTKRAHRIEHICTPINGFHASAFDAERLRKLLGHLSPTPALCGFPRQLALQVIGESENFRRGCYGGFCGPYHNPSDFALYVNLRSALVEADRFCMFAGGGITLKSDKDAEWDETVMKSKTLLQCVVLEQ